MISRQKKFPPQAWWSEPGPATCDFCFGAFHLEVGYYCTDCDRPICPVCVLALRERHAVICPECGPGDDH